MCRSKISILFFWMFYIIIGLPNKASGQKNRLSEQTYRFFDGMRGQTNLGIFKGIAYSNPYRVVNERSQFFNTADFILGSVQYDGQPYFDIPLRYDVYNDQLLVENSALANTPIMIFDTSKVTSFSIGEHNFEHIDNEIPSSVTVGFFELLLDRSTLQLYKRHTKKIFKRTDEQTLYYEFKNGHYYLLRYQEVYFRFKKVNELPRIFSGQKKAIKEAVKQYGNLKKTDADAYVMAVLNNLLLMEPINKEKVR